MDLEKTDVAQRHFNKVTSEIPMIVVSNEATYDMFEDHSIIEATCDTENPESCESCQ